MFAAQSWPFKRCFRGWYKPNGRMHHHSRKEARLITQVGTEWIKSNRTAFALVAATLLGIFASAVYTSNAAARELHIVAFGDSLTAGYGLPPNADFASRLEVALKTRGHDVRITNAGVSGDTTAGGLARFDWAIPNDTDGVILELSSNDALRGISPAIARSNLNQILARLKNRNIEVLLAGMQSPANWGDAYKAEFDGMFEALARQHDTLLYPFFMEGVIDQPKLKLPDALHPNAAGVDEIVRRILPSVEKLIEKARQNS